MKGKVQTIDDGTIDPEIRRTGQYFKIFKPGGVLIRADDACGLLN